MKIYSKKYLFLLFFILMFFVEPNISFAVNPSPDNLPEGYQQDACYPPHYGIDEGIKRLFDIVLQRPSEILCLAPVRRFHEGKWQCASSSDIIHPQKILDPKWCEQAKSEGNLASANNSCCPAGYGTIPIIDCDISVDTSRLCCKRDWSDTQNGWPPHSVQVVNTCTPAIIPTPLKIEGKIRVTCGPEDDYPLEGQTVVLRESSSSNYNNLVSTMTSGGVNQVVPYGYDIPEDLADANYNFYIESLKIGNETIEPESLDIDYGSDKNVFPLAALKDRKLTYLRKHGDIVVFHYPKCPPPGTFPTVTPTPSPRLIAETETYAQIFGYHGGSFTLAPGQDQISVGARVSTKGQKDHACDVVDSVDLKFEKVGYLDKDGTEKMYSTPFNLTPIGEGDDKQYIYQNCRSYLVDLAGNTWGIYRLTARYTPHNTPSDPVIYKESEDIITVKIDDYRNAKFIPTKATVPVSSAASDVEGVQTENKVQGKVSSEQKISLKQLFEKNKNNNVAGVKVLQKDGQVTAINDQSTSSNNIQFTPSVGVENESCSADKIPEITTIVNKIKNNGSVEVVVNDASYPNCNPLKVNVDLSQDSRIEATVVYPGDPASKYSPSQGETTVYVNNTHVKVAPDVKLSSNPDTSLITVYDRPIIEASTNSVVENPVFEVEHNGIKEEPRPASSATTNCADGTGSCVYTLELFQPNGRYEITFRNGEAVDTLIFDTNLTGVGRTTGGGGVGNDIVSAGLMVGGQEVSLPLDGSLIDLELDDSPQTVYELVLRNAAGGVVKRTSITVVYDAEGEASARPTLADGETVPTEIPQPGEPTPTPAKTIIGWTCEYNSEENYFYIDEHYSNDTKRIESVCSGGQRCQPKHTDGYSFDAECLLPEVPTPTTAPTPYITAWECGFSEDGQALIWEKYSDNQKRLEQMCEVGGWCEFSGYTGGIPDAKCVVAVPTVVPEESVPPSSGGYQGALGNYYWYCSADSSYIVEVDPDGNAKIMDNGDCGSNGMTCYPKDNPGYASDAECR